VKRHPDLFSAFIGTGQVVNAAELAAWSYDHTLARLHAEHEEADIAEVERVGPPPHRSQAEDEIVRAWTDRYLGAADARFLLSSVSVALRNRPYSWADWRVHETGHLEFSLPVMHATWNSLDLNALGYDMPVPFCILDGRSDQLAPPELAAPYFQKIRAPGKAMTLIDGGHFAFISNSDEFLRALLACIGTGGQP
jgi:pimeloyl-ACP methyl ester carboxylesterase